MHNLPKSALPKLYSNPASQRPDEYHWRDDAACLGLDTEAFYPTQGETAHMAKRVCEHCSVQAECLRYALQMGDDNGVWGGLGESERRRMVRRGYRAAA